LKVRYCFDKKPYETEAEGCSFMLSNKNSSYFMKGINSKYRGLYLNVDDELFKIIDEIRIDGQEQSLDIGYRYAKIKKQDNSETYIMQNYIDALFVDLNKGIDIDFVFDVKKAYDNRQWGRFYEVNKQRNKIIVTFTKKTDRKEDKKEGINIVLHDIRF
jgi:hypothetical protein